MPSEVGNTGMVVLRWEGGVQPAICLLLQMADCGGLPQVVQVRDAHSTALAWGCTEPLALL